MSIQTNSIPRQFFSFALAKGFRDAATCAEFQGEKNRTERLGDALRWGVGSAADILLREIRNPIMIIALTSLALLAVTIAFYPATALAIVAKVFPLVLYVKPWMVKLALYVLVQTTIAGIGARTYGRLCNKELMHAWSEGRIKAVHIGERVI